MNTVAKGNKLEAEVFRLFRRIIDEGDFYAKKEFCKLPQKARYFSRTREKEIEFDLAVEIWLPGASRPSLICPIECKNYAHAVPVDDVEEFVSKYEQVEAHKGIIVSRGPFQQGAQTYAKNKGLGLIRYLADDTHKWVLHRSTAANVVLAKADHRITLSKIMTDETFQSPVLDVVCESAGGATTSLWEFFGDLLGNPESQEWMAVQSPIRQFGSVVPYVEETEIEALAVRVADSSGESHGPIDLEKLCGNELRSSGLKVLRYANETHPEVSPNVLGIFRFEENTIELFEAHAKNPGQMRFTLAHELGHHFLRHAQYLALDVCDEADVESRPLPLIDLTDISRLEWQANHFAACLLIPRRSLLHRFRTLLEQFNIKDKGYGVLYVDGQPCNQESFAMICSHLSQAFQVSFGAIAVRLKVLWLLNDQRWASAATDARSQW